MDSDSRCHMDSDSRTQNNRPTVTPWMSQNVPLCHVTGVRTMWCMTVRRCGAVHLGMVQWTVYPGWCRRAHVHWSLLLVPVSGHRSSWYCPSPLILVLPSPLILAHVPSVRLSCTVRQALMHRPSGSVRQSQSVSLRIHERVGIRAKDIPFWFYRAL